MPVTVSLERYEAIEFCGFVRGDNTGILVKYPAASISFTSAFDVFSIGVMTRFGRTEFDFIISKLKLPADMDRRHPFRDGNLCHFSHFLLLNKALTYQRVAGGERWAIFVALVRIHDFSRYVCQSRGSCQLISFTLKATICHADSRRRNFSLPPGVS